MKILQHGFAQICKNYCKNYCTAVNTVNILTVTNDRAEKGVALIEEFNHVLTHSKEKAHYLLQVVSEHLKKFHKCKKIHS